MLKNDRKSQNTQVLDALLMGDRSLPCRHWRGSTVHASLHASSSCEAGLRHHHRRTSSDNGDKTFAEYRMAS